MKEELDSQKKKALRIECEKSSNTQRILRSHHTAEREREETETETELELETLNINGGRISTSFLHALSCN
jgi:hypothetical protein